MTSRLFAAALAVLAAFPLFGDLHVWRGTISHFFSDPRNWDGGSPAGDPEAELVFPVALRQAVANDLDGLTVKSLRFEVDRYRIEGKPISLVEGAAVDARHVELACDLVFDGHRVDPVSGGVVVYSKADRRSVPPIVAHGASVPSGAIEVDLDISLATARVTPGAETTWHFDGYAGSDFGFSFRSFYHALSGDTDGDGQVRWQYPFWPDPSYATVWCVLDQSAGVIHSATSSGDALEVEPLDIRFLRDAAGNHAWADLPAPGGGSIMLTWVRPGTGAWSLYASGWASRNAAGEYRMLFPLDGAVPVDGSPATPAEVLPGDFMIATGLYHRKPSMVQGGRVDEAFAEASSTHSEIGIAMRFANHVSESDGHASVDIFRMGSSDRTSTVHYRTVDDTALAGVDYQPVDGTITFRRGEMVKTVDIPTIDDDLYDHRDLTRFRVVLSEPTGASLRNDSVAALIADDEHVPVVQVEHVKVEEGDQGVRQAAVDVTLSNRTTDPVTVKWRAGGEGTGQRGELQFAPRERKQTIFVPYTANTVTDGDRTIVVEILAATNAAEGSVGSVTILDDDPFVVSAAHLTIDEAETKALAGVTLSRPRTEPFAVVARLSVSDQRVIEGEDYAPVDCVLTFAPGETRKDCVVPIHEDRVAEDDEAIGIVLEEGPGYSVRNGSITIRDDGDFPVVTVDDVTDLEDEFARFRVNADPPPQKIIPVRVTAVDGSAVRDVDFRVADSEIELGIGSPTATIYLFPDTEVEADETFTVRIATSANPSVILASAQGIIRDSTFLGPRLSVASASAREGNPATFTVTMSKPSEELVSFRVRTVGDTAAAGVDFEPVSNIYTLEPGELSAVIEVRVHEDAVAEQHETFAVELSQPWNAAIGVGVGRGRIFDDDDPEVPVFGVSNVAASEGSGVVRFTVTLARVMSARTAIAFGTGDGTGKAGEDYLASHGEVTFEPGETSKTVEIALVNDTRFEEDETFTLRLGNGLEATATIVNDDAKARSRSVRH